MLADDRRPYTVPRSHHAQPRPTLTKIFMQRLLIRIHVLHHQQVRQLDTKLTPANTLARA